MIVDKPQRVIEVMETFYAAFLATFLNFYFKKFLIMRKLKEEYNEYLYTFHQIY